MKRRRRKIFETPEEREEWEIRSEATDRMLRDRIAKGEAELRAAARRGRTGIALP